MRTHLAAVFLASGFWEVAGLRRGPVRFDSGSRCRRLEGGGDGTLTPLRGPKAVTGCASRDRADHDHLRKHSFLGGYPRVPSPAGARPIAQFFQKDHASGAAVEVRAIASDHCARSLCKYRTRRPCLRKRGPLPCTRHFSSELTLT